MFEYFYGKSKYQPFFEKLLRAALKGMNIGSGSGVEKSGEKRVVDYLKKLSENCTEKLVLFDIGANIGKYSKILSETFRNEVEIHSFEPSAETFETLQNNLKGYENIIKINKGVGSKTELLILYSNKALPGLSSIYKRRLDHFGSTLDKKEAVQITTIDEYCREKKTSKIDLLKLDIEGNELEALRGAKEMLAGGKIRMIQFEFGGCNIDSRTYFQDFFYLLKDEYDIFRILKDGLYPIKKYKEEYEQFLTTNFLAVNKKYHKNGN